MIKSVSMDNDLLNILSDGDKDFDNQKLMDYLSDKLSPEEKHEFEKKMADSEMLDDVVEGLEKFKNKKDVGKLVEHLNANLKKHLDEKKSKKTKREIKNLNGLYLAIILILLIILVSFLIIKRHLDNEKPVVKPPVESGAVSAFYKKTHSQE
jgi:hypothetical protein